MTFRALLLHAVVIALALPGGVRACGGSAAVARRRAEAAGRASHGRVRQPLPRRGRRTRARRSATRCCCRRRCCSRAVRARRAACSPIRWASAAGSFVGRSAAARATRTRTTARRCRCCVNWRMLQARTIPRRSCCTRSPPRVARAAPNDTILPEAMRGDRFRTARPRRPRGPRSPPSIPRGPHGAACGRRQAGRPDARRNRAHPPPAGRDRRVARFAATRDRAARAPRGRRHAVHGDDARHLRAPNATPATPCARSTCRRKACDA